MENRKGRESQYPSRSTGEFYCGGALGASVGVLGVLWSVDAEPVSHINDFGVLSFTAE
jgi:hypothetical protein